MQSSMPEEREQPVRGAFEEMHDWPSYGDEEVAAIARVLGDRPQKIGREVAAFEEEAAAYLGVDHTVAFANATLGLEASLAVMLDGSDGEIIVPRRAYFACMSSILRAGLAPVAVDVDRETQNVSPEILAPFLNDRTAAVMTVDMAGWPIDGRSIGAQTGLAGVPLLADCAQALGATHDGGTTAQSATASVYSFCHDKMISTCGEGGMVATSDEGLAQALREWQGHGKRSDAQAAPWVAPPHWSIGTNARLTDAQAAVGRVQLRKLNDWIDRRINNAAVMTSALSGLPGLRLPSPGPEVRHTFYKYYAFLDPHTYGTEGRDEVLRRLWAAGIPAYQGACSDVFAEPGVPDWVDRGDCPTTVEMGETSIAFIVHHEIRAATMNMAAEVIADVLGTVANSVDHD